MIRKQEMGVSFPDFNRPERRKYLVAAALEELAHRVRSGELVSFTSIWKGGDQMELTAEVVLPLPADSVTFKVGPADLLKDRDTKPANLIRRCVECETLFESKPGVYCPKCGNKCAPVNLDKDMVVRLNEHELRVVLMWAQQHVQEHWFENQKRMLAAIVGRLEKQLPEGAEPLKLPPPDESPSDPGGADQDYEG